MWTCDHKCIENDVANNLLQLEEAVGIGRNLVV